MPTPHVRCHCSLRRLSPAVLVAAFSFKPFRAASVGDLSLTSRGTQSHTREERLRLAASHADIGIECERNCNYSDRKKPSNPIHYCPSVGGLFRSPVVVHVRLRRSVGYKLVGNRAALLEGPRGLSQKGKRPQLGEAEAVLRDVPSGRMAWCSNPPDREEFPTGNQIFFRSAVPAAYPSLPRETSPIPFGRGLSLVPAPFGQVVYHSQPLFVAA